MPELPDVVVYIEHLSRRTRGETLTRTLIKSPNLLRTATPPLREAHGKRVLDVRRMGKRIVFALEDDLYLVVHLMIAGRFRWKPDGAKLPGKIGSAVIEFSSGTLLLTEASTRKRAAMHLIRGVAALSELDPGGLEVLEADLDQFRAALQNQNRTLKRSLTDPHIFSGIGNAYSDEILHAARLSPLKQTRKLGEEEIVRLHEATRKTLRLWTERLRAETGEKFPEKVTAFRPGMAVHGRFKEPCPDCTTAVQRIVYANNEMNYCPRCQTGGRLLADRSLSRLLKNEWPRTIEELDES